MAPVVADFAHRAPASEDLTCQAPAEDYFEKRDFAG